MTDPSDTLASIRRWLIVLLALGLVGTEIELLLLDHYEDAWQLVPIAVIGLACSVLVWYAASGSAATVRALQAIMVIMVICGLLGVVLHYRGNLEFQLEIDASQPRWQLFKKIMRAKAPPALAPGLMTQLGLLGLVCTYQHPSDRRHATE